MLVKKYLILNNYEHQHMYLVEISTLSLFLFADEFCVNLCEFNLSKKCLPATWVTCEDILCIKLLEGKGSLGYTTKSHAHMLQLPNHTHTHYNFYFHYGPHSHFYDHFSMYFFSSSDLLLLPHTAEEAPYTKQTLKVSRKAPCDLPVSKVPLSLCNPC